jgi:hypothetical protein
MNEEQLNDFRMNLKKDDEVLLSNETGYERGIFRRWFDNTKEIADVWIYGKSAGSGVQLDDAAWRVNQIYPPDFLLKSKLTKKGKELGDLYDNL